MSQLATLFEAMWAILKWGIVFLLVVVVLRWGTGWIEGKIRGPRPVRDRKPGRPRKEVRAERGRLAREKGLAFEAKLVGRFRAAGFKVKETPVSGDFGVDLIVGNAGRRYAIQVKHHRDKVGCKALDAVYSGKAYYGCDAAILIATGGVTEQAAPKRTRLVWRSGAWATWLVDFDRGYPEPHDYWTHRRTLQTQGGYE